MNIIFGDIKAYPAEFPLPSALGLGGDIEYGVARNASLKGYPAQTRFSGSNPTVLIMSFQMEVALFSRWSSWINEWGIDAWVLMRLVDQYDGTFLFSDFPNDNIIRFQDYDMRPLGPAWVTVNATVDLMPQDIGDGLPGINGDIEAPDQFGNWIIGGTPPSPSPDWIVAGTPSAPSNANDVDAQNPSDHRT